MTSAASQLLSMDGFDHKSAPFNLESSFDSSFNYMDNGLDYFQYPPTPLGVSAGLPSTGSLDFGGPLSTMDNYTYSSPSFGAPSPPRPYSPPEGGSVSPATLTYHLSAETPESINSGRVSRASGSRSPSAPLYASVPRSQHRFNPMNAVNRPTRAVVAAQKRRASASKAEDDEDLDEDDVVAQEPEPSAEPASKDSRRETVRKQRIESEQRRRDELREGYARLKETLPASNQKASKVSLLDRATSHIKYLEAVKEQLEVRLKSADHEVHRLRNVNEALMLNRAGAALAPQSFSN